MRGRHITRRRFVELAGGTLAAGVRLRAQTPAHLARAFLVSAAGCGRATGYAEASKIVTVGERTHVAWLDAEPGGFRVRIRTLDRVSGAWSPAWTIGEAQDNHGGPALTVDRRGFLHVVYYPHHQAFRYRRSKRAFDASEWEPEVSFGEELSYPVLLCAPDDTLVLTARRSFRRPAGTPKQPWELELWKKPPGGDWRKSGVVLRSRHTDYAHFQDSLAWGPDHRTIHLGCRIYETTGRPNETPLQTVGYLVSRDAGETWQRADGTRVSQPATADRIDVLASGGGATGRTLYSGAIAVSARGVPHTLHMLREHGVARTYLATPGPDGRGWTKRDLHAFLPQAFRDRDLVLPGAMTFSVTGRATIVATLAELETGKSDDWGHASNRVVRFWSDDAELRHFECEVLTAPESKTPHWLPSLERPTGHHTIPHSPGILYQGGSGGAGLHERELNNHVWWRPANGG